MTMLRQSYTRRSTILTATVVAAGILSACNASDGADGEPAGPLISNISTLGSPVYPGGQMEVHVSASSPSGESLSYEWSIPDGWDGTDTGDTMVVITAPEDQAEKGEVSVEVSDGDHSRNASVKVATRGPAIEKFSANPLPFTEGNLVTLTTDTYNHDGLDLSYDYIIGGMPFADQGAQWDWATRSMGGRYRLEVNVTDSHDFSTSAVLDTSLEGISEWPTFGGDRQRNGLSTSSGAQGATGNIVWTFEAGGSVSTTSPVIGPDGTLYVGSNDSKIYALDPAEGLGDSDRVLWSYETGSFVRSSPAIGADGTVYVGSRDNHVYALDPTEKNLSDDERLKWSFETDGSIRYSLAIGADGTVYVGSLDNHLYALEPADGAKKWAFETDDSVRTAPAIGADGTIYIGSNDHHLYALDPVDGAKKWAFEADEGVRSSPAIGTDGTVYVGSDDNNLYALDPVDGSKKWAFEADDRVRSSPAIGADGTVYVGSNDNHIYAVDPTDGSKKWAFETGDRILSSIAIAADGTLYVGSGDDNIYALDPSEDNLTDAERQKWAIETGDRVQSTPAIGADGTVYIGSYDDNIYAIY